MKFPKSVHAEGWGNHFDETPRSSDALVSDVAPKPGLKKPLGMNKPAKRVADMPLNLDATPSPTMARVGPTAAAVDPAPRNTNAMPWVIGGGVALAAIALAVTMSRNLSTDHTTPAVVAQTTTSPEDAQLQANPTAAGPSTSAPETQVAQADAAPAEEPVATSTTPAATEPQPAARQERPTVAAAAPAEPKAESKAPAPTFIRSTPAPTAAPVTRTLTPQPETLAQASPSPAALGGIQPSTPAVTPSAAATPSPEATPTPALPLAAAPATPMAAAPATPAVVSPATTPDTATAVPPVAQAEPQAQPQAPVAEDAGITQKVRVALASEAALAGLPIAVSTDHGVVKLEGQAPDAQSRERATVVAAATVGVKAVDNRLTLPPMASLDASRTGS